MKSDLEIVREENILLQSNICHKPRIYSIDAFYKDYKSRLKKHEKHDDDIFDHENIVILTRINYEIKRAFIRTTFKEQIYYSSIYLSKKLSEKAISKGRNVSAMAKYPCGYSLGVKEISRCSDDDIACEFNESDRPLLKGISHRCYYKTHPIDNPTTDKVSTKMSTPIEQNKGELSNFLLDEVL